MPVVPSLRLEDVPIRILGISGSPRRGSNSRYLLDCALEGATEVGGVETEVLDFHGKKVLPCRGCEAYCRTRKECSQKDSFSEFCAAWLRADAIVWSLPVYTLGPPSQVRAFMDRLGEVIFQRVRDKSTGHPYWNKVTGIIVQGSSRFGNQEIVIQAMLDHVVQMDCLPIAGDMPHNHLGVAGHVEWGERAEDQPELTQMCRQLGRRVGEMAKIIKAGTLALQRVLPDQYFYSRTSLGDIQRPPVLVQAGGGDR